MNLRRQQFRKTIADFIESRRVDKSKGDTEDYQALAEKYDYANWLADAARRVGQIQAVTHVLKATHPDAKGSSLYVSPVHLPARTELGSHALAERFAQDVVGNAAALDVYKLLKLEMDGHTLLHWLQLGDADLLAALADDAQTAQAHRAAFCGLLRSDERYSSDTHAKQVYWCHGENACADDHYHLLQPLFPSSLVHAVHTAIQYSRFDPAVVEARKARKEGKPHATGIPEYLGLGLRKLGGTKPQNISQLNSERGGINYLLASLPPQWQGDRQKPYFGISSALSRFEYFEDVRAQLQALAKHLQSYDKRRLPETVKRERLERLEHRLGARLAAFGKSAQAWFEPGWTRDAACDLPLCEQVWLDPGRAELPLREDAEGQAEDLAFRQALEAGDWPDEVAQRFAAWLSEWLRQQDLPMGDVELRHFARQALIDAEWPSPLRRDLPGKRPRAQGAAS